MMQIMKTSRVEVPEYLGAVYSRERRRISRRGGCAWFQWRLGGPFGRANGGPSGRPGGCGG